MKNNLLRTLLAAFVAAGALGRMAAQTASPAPAKEEVIELEKVSVSGVAPEQQILPTA